MSPDYSSITALNIREEFRGTAEASQQNVRGQSVREIVEASVGLSQIQLMKAVDQRLRQLEERISRLGTPSQVPYESFNVPAAPPPSAVTQAWAAPPAEEYPVPPLPRSIAEVPPALSGGAYLNQPVLANRPPQAQGNTGPYAGSQQRHMSATAANPYGGGPYPWPQEGIPSARPAFNYAQPDIQTNPRNPRVDIAKWGIKFDGTSKTITVEDFVFRIEVLRQDYGCPWSEVIISFHQLLEGNALGWYWTHKRLYGFRSWSDIREAMLAQFRRFESEFEIQKKILERRQQAQETFEDFYNAVIALRNQQNTPYSEIDLVEIMKGNLKPSLASLMFSIRVSGLNQFRQEVRRAESMLTNQRQAYQQRSYQQPRVHELSYEDEPFVDFEVDAIQRSGRLVCWNCGHEGHNFNACKAARRVFCYKCGKDKVKVEDCPRCQGNLPRSASQSGETRSTQTETQ